MIKPIDTGILVLRVSIAILMLLHGINKLAKGVAGIAKMLADQGLPEWLAWGVYLGEIVAPLMIILGIRTRLAAFTLAFTMLAAVYLAHSDDLLVLTKTGAWGIELQALYFFAALTLVFTGGGRYAISRNKMGD
ncbi:MAG: DoxX family protein [Bacteroidetes bacterium]|nr:DoxX family protein [Bacteroidota bacterium]